MDVMISRVEVWGTFIANTETSNDQWVLAETILCMTEWKTELGRTKCYIQRSGRYKLTGKYTHTYKTDQGILITLQLITCTSKRNLNLRHMRVKASHSSFCLVLNQRLSYLGLILNNWSIQNLTYELKNLAACEEGPMNAMRPSAMIRISSNNTYIPDDGWWTVHMTVLPYSHKLT